MSNYTARLELRLTPEQLELIELAASVVGSSVPSYAIATLVEDATATVARADRIGLSPLGREDGDGTPAVGQKPGGRDPSARHPVWDPR